MQRTLFLICFFYFYLVQCFNIAIFSRIIFTWPNSLIFLIRYRLLINQASLSRHSRREKIPPRADRGSSRCNEDRPSLRNFSCIVFRIISRLSTCVLCASPGSVTARSRKHPCAQLSGCVLISCKAHDWYDTDDGVSVDDSLAGYLRDIRPLDGCCTYNKSSRVD